MKEHAFVGTWWSGAMCNTVTLEPVGKTWAFAVGQGRFAP